MLHRLDAEATENAELEQAIELSFMEAEEAAMEQAVSNSVKEAQQALAESMEDAERARSRIEAHGVLTRDAFVSAMSRLLRLAIDGLPGCLHSMNSLRNLELARQHGDQQAAAKQALKVPLEPRSKTASRELRSSS